MEPKESSDDDQDEEEDNSDIISDKERLQSLIKLIGEYKKVNETEKQAYEKKLKEEGDKINALMKENNLLREEFDQIVEEYEKKLEEVNKEKVLRTKENLENLQTLLQELNFIDEKNGILETQMEELKKETAEMKEKLNIKEQIIKEYEIKVQKLATPQQRMSMKITEGSTNADMKKQEERLHKILDLAHQIESLATVSPKGLESSLQNEKTAHEATRKLLEEERSRAKEFAARAAHAEQRIKKLTRGTLKLQQPLSEMEPAAYGAISPELQMKWKLSGEKVKKKCGTQAPMGASRSGTPPSQAAPPPVHARSSQTVQVNQTNTRGSLPVQETKPTLPPKTLPTSQSTTQLVTPKPAELTSSQSVQVNLTNSRGSLPVQETKTTPPKTLPTSQRTTQLVSQKPAEPITKIATQTGTNLDAETRTKIMNLMKDPEKGVKRKDRRFMLTTYKNCFVGSEAVVWFLQNGFAKTREEALVIGNWLMSFDEFQHANKAHGFEDHYLLYLFPEDAALNEALAANKKNRGTLRKLSFLPYLGPAVDKEEQTLPV